jgi:hypothetical protein
MLSVSRRILVSAPRDSVQKYLSDLREIAKYEQKVDAIELTTGAEGVEASASGRFLGLPWRGTFRFEMTRDGGYRGVMVQGPLSRMESRIVLRPVIGGTLIEHDEIYDLPFFMRPLKSLVKRWLDHTLESELDFIKEGAEALNRRLQLQHLDA